MKRTCPFQNLSTHGRINLARFAVLVFYLFQVGLALYSDSLFNTIGSDFISFWSVGRIANTEGYGRIYDLSLLSEIQKPFHETVATDNVYAPIPTPFFAIFILPLQILAWFDPRIGFGFWTILNLAGLIFYPERHQGLGASGMIMGALGLLAAQWLTLLKHGLTPRQLAIRGMLSGGLLLVLLGFSPERNVDVLAHVAGFGTGLGLGVILALLPTRARQSLWLDCTAFLLCFALAGATWCLALR